ncbi:MAG: hydantoinase B/oxoprolinase family protein [Alphaproteobacteria bacterium]|nr:hydantoinase B/oxoprolinase family protein [Alphaproteobacteria bacterium]
MSNDIDPFQLEVIRHSFDAVAEDMSLTLMRTAHSGIVRDSLDFSTSICDAKGQPLAQGICTPMQLGSFYDAMVKLIDQYRGRINAGDVFIGNDPYEAAGQHLPDIYIAMPIFDGDRVVAWSTTIAHHSDVGGIVAGSNALGAEEIYQEGLRLPIVKFVDAGKRNEALWDVIAINVRTPDKVLGDLQAQMAACMSGEREMKELFKRYGTDTILRYGEHLHDYTERLTRAELREIPEGVYRFTDHIDGLGQNPEPIVLEAAVTIRDGSAIVDWTGTSPQVKGGINPSFPFTKACAYTAFRSVLKADLPTCHGFTRAIEVRAPLGSLVNPTFPAPCGARGITGYRMIDCLIGALAPAAPHRVTADTSGGSTLPTIAGYQNGKAFVFCETFMGTWGGTSGHDGQNGVPHMGANQSNVPVEMIESDYPIRIERYGLVPDTAGPGRYRGGLSLTREYRILNDEAILNIRSDKRRYPPHGLFGGGTGGPSFNLINPEAENKLLPVLMTEVERLKRGDVYRHIMAGGGGYGDPLERDPADVLEDAIEEKVSIAHAAEAYGVVIAPGTKPRLDLEQTARLRARLRAERPPALYSRTTL